MRRIRADPPVKEGDQSLDTDLNLCESVRSQMPHERAVIAPNRQSDRTS